MIDILEVRLEYLYFMIWLDIDVPRRYSDTKI